MLVKVNEAPLKVLDWAVARAEGFDAQLREKKRIALIDKNKNTLLREYSPTTDWSYGGPILAREKIALMYHDDDTVSAIVFRKQTQSSQGPTALIAAMRCYVISKMGEEIEVPDHICQ